MIFVIMFKIISIPFDRALKGFDEELINRFVLNKHIINYRSEFFSEGNDKYWSIFIEYAVALESQPVNVEIELNKDQKLLFEKLRIWRKERAEKDGVPVFVIGSNKEFQEIAKNSPKSLESLKSVKGFGTGKVSKYGKDIVELINGFYQTR